MDAGRRLGWGSPDLCRVVKNDAEGMPVATAHPAKFPAAVRQACGIEPKLPDWLGDLMARKERFTVLPSEIKMVEDYLGRHSREVR